MIYTLTLNPSLDRTLVIPELKVGAYNRGQATRLNLGGKGINVSRTLRELGEESVIVGYFAGYTGKILLQGLRNNNFCLEALDLQGETRSNITLIESNSGRWTKLNEFGPEVSKEKANALMNLVQSHAKKGDVWVLSGSLPRGLQADFYAQIIAVVKENGGAAFLDASGSSLAHGYQAAPYLLKINQVEAETALGRSLPTTDSCVAALADFQHSGICIAAISRSEKSAIFIDANEVVEACPPNVTVDNPVGAGDAMMAGLVQGYVNNWNLEQIASWSVAVGTASAMQDGTAAPKMSQIELIHAQVEVHHLKP